MTVLGEQVHIEHVMSEENEEGNQMPEPLIIEAFQHYAVLYIKYMQIFSKLEQCYDSMVHPQKRIDVKMTLELVIRRVIELRHMLVKWNPPNPDVAVETGDQPPFPWEYVNLDDILSDLKLPPATMEVPIPRYFKEDNMAIHRQRDRTVGGYISMKLGVNKVPVELEEFAEASTIEMTYEQAIEAIQRNERGRQGKQRANFVKEMRDDDRKKKNYIDSATMETDPEIAAANIQRLFRGYYSRSNAMRERDEELVFIGMKPKTYDNDELENDLKLSYKKRKQEQIDNREAYEKALEDLRLEVLEEEGPEMRDALREERTKWVTDTIAETNEIPIDLEKFYEMKNPPPVEEAAAEDPKDKKGKKDDKKKDDKKKKGEKAPKPIEKPSLDGKTELTETMQSQVEDFEGVWDERDESDNFIQKHDPELAKERIIRKQVELELKEQVDEMLKNSLAKISAQHAKGKKGKGKKGKGKKGKKGKGKKGKGKKEKPLPGAKLADIKNMDPDHMMSVLIEHKMINNVENVKVEDLIGDFNYLGRVIDTQQRKDVKRWLPQNPSMAQLRASMSEYAILPLGSLEVKKRIMPENNVRSVLLYGPPGSGKTLMAQAVANELGALFINLSPDKLEGKFTGNKEATKLMHMAFTVAKEPSFAPAVIYFDQAADYFKAKAKGKKKKKGGDDDGAKAGPDLKRFMKDLMIYKNQALTLEDRVVVIGACTNPEDADVKQLKHTGKGKPEKQGFFEKFLFFPYPGYPDRVMLWKYFVKKCLNGEGGKKEVPDNFDISSLAHISEGYSAGAIYKAVRQTLTPRRVQSIEGGKRPLTETEFINALARQEVTYQSDAKKYMDFTCKITDLDKRKKEKEDAKKKEEGGGDDKKGKKKK
ncbi:hypothetical protein TrST_g13451 [Triparma strigata]|nr:hypothetical protein TrST_g13451 [Triparma strigata]